MQTLYILFDKRIGIFFVFCGIVMLLVGFKIIYLKLKTPEETERWYKKNGQFMKIGGVFQIAIGLFLLLLSLVMT